MKQCVKLYKQFTIYCRTQKINKTGGMKLPHVKFAQNSFKRTCENSTLQLDITWLYTIVNCSLFK